MARNPIIENALQQGFHSGGTIGDISGGTGATVSVRTGGRGSGGSSSQPVDIAQERATRIEETLKHQEEVKAKKEGREARQVAVGGLSTSKYGINIIYGTQSSTLRPDLAESGVTLPTRRKAKILKEERIARQATQSTRPAELASRIIGTKEMSPGAEALFKKRKAELLLLAGEEAGLAHYPLYNVGAKRPIGRQEYGTYKSLILNTLKLYADKNESRINISNSGVNMSIFDNTQNISDNQKPFQKAYDLKIGELTKEFQLSGEFLRQQKAQKKENRPAQYLTGLGYVGLKTFEGFTYPFIHPIKTGKGVIELFKSPYKVLYATLEKISEEPVGELSKIGGGALAIKTIKVGLTKANPIQFENIKFRTTTSGNVKVTEIGVPTKAGSTPKMFEYVSPSGTTQIKLGLVPKDFVGVNTLPAATSTSNIAVRTVGINVLGNKIPLLALKTEKVTTDIPNFQVQIKGKETQPSIDKGLDIFKQKGFTPEQQFDLESYKSELDMGEITKKQYDAKVSKILKESPKVNIIKSEPKIETVVYGGKKSRLKAELIVGSNKPKVQSQLSELKSAIPPPITGTGTKVIQNIFDLTPKEKIRIASAQTQIQILQGEKGLTVKEALFNVKQFKNKEIASKIIEKAAARRRGIFFGSATMQQLPEGFRLIPGDIDIYFPNLKESTLIKKVIPNLQKKLIKAGEEVAIGKDLKSLEINGEKILEVKAGKGTITGEIAPEGGLGFKVDNKNPIKFGKARATKAGEQLKRKGIASTYFRPASVEAETPVEFADAGVLPRAKRTKDLPGFIVQARGIIELRKTGFESLERKTPSIKMREIQTEEATKALEKYIATFTPEQQARIVKLIDENAPARKIEFKITPESKKARSGLEGAKTKDVLLSPSINPKGNLALFSSVTKNKKSPENIASSQILKSSSVKMKSASQISKVTKQISYNLLGKSPKISPTRSKSNSPYFSKSKSPSLYNLYSASPSYNIYSNFPINISTPPPPTQYFNIPKTKQSKKKKSFMESFGLSSSYTPDLESVLFNIRGKKPTGDIGFLGARPIIR